MAIGWCWMVFCYGVVCMASIHGAHAPNGPAVTGLPFSVASPSAASMVRGTTMQTMERTKTYSNDIDIYDTLFDLHGKLIHLLHPGLSLESLIQHSYTGLEELHTQLLHLLPFLPYRIVSAQVPLEHYGVDANGKPLTMTELQRRLKRVLHMLKLADQGRMPALYRWFRIPPLLVWDAWRASHSLVAPIQDHSHLYPYAKYVSRGWLQAGHASFRTIPVCKAPLIHIPMRNKVAASALWRWVSDDLWVMDYVQITRKDALRWYRLSGYQHLTYSIRVDAHGVNRWMPPEKKQEDVWYKILDRICTEPNLLNGYPKGTHV